MNNIKTNYLMGSTGCQIFKTRNIAIINIKYPWHTWHNVDWGKKTFKFKSVYYKSTNRKYLLVYPHVLKYVPVGRHSEGYWPNCYHWLCFLYN